jgi:hypothetical protein
LRQASVTTPEAEDLNVALVADISKVPKVKANLTNNSYHQTISTPKNRACEATIAVVENSLEAVVNSAEVVVNSEEVEEDAEVEAAEYAKTTRGKNRAQPQP